MMSKDSSLSKNQKWWEARIANNIWKEYNNLEYRNRELLNVFQTASKNIRDELYELAEKYSKDGILSRADMYREKHLQKLEQKYHEMIEQLGSDTEKLATKNMQEAFKNVNQITGESINAEEFATPNKKVMNAALKEPWRGSNFSARLWGSEETIGQMQKLERALDAVLTYGLQTGQSVTQMAVNLNNVMGKGFNESLRLVRTESMHYMNQAALMRYKDSGIDKVQIIAALDERTCSECGKYHEKIYPIDKCPVLPFHPNCRCTVIPYIDDGEKYTKLSDTTDRWAEEVRKELHADEWSLSRRTKESAVIYDSNGKYLFTKRGTEKEIVFTKAEAKRMKQCIVSHNHPSGASFSIPDWQLFQELKLQEIRVIAEDKVYYLRRVNDFELKMSEEEFENELKRIRKSVRRKYQKMYEGGIINKKERLLLSSDEYNRKAAEKFGFEYGEERLDG